MAWRPATRLPDAQSQGGRYSAGARHRSLQLLLGHLRATFDAELLGVVVQLFAGAAARAMARLLATAAARRPPSRRATRGVFRLARAGPFLVDCAGGDLLSAFLGAPLFLLALLDVLVLAPPFAAFLDTPGWHPRLLPLW